MKVKEFRVVFSEQAIRARVAELGAEIQQIYGNEPLVMVCVLKGAFVFFADLVRHMTNNPELDFVRLASYGSSTESSTISFTKDIEIAIEGKHVLIVEDIIDTGHSMDFLLRQLAARGAKSLRLAVLIDKYERREVPVSADFVGFSMHEGFIVGYGLDYAEKYRELTAIYEIIPE